MTALSVLSKTAPVVLFQHLPQVPVLPTNVPETESSVIMNLL